MPRFFIDRPIFAWVIAIVIMLAGALSILRLPVSQYPPIAPPAIVINASYPGRVGQDGRGLGHPGHRAEDDRARRPAVHELVVGLLRPGDGDADLRRRHQPRHRPGAGAEQAAARAAAAAAGGAAAGRAGREVGAQLPDGDRLRVRGRRAARSYDLVRLPRLHGPGSAVARHRRRRGAGVRRAVRDAHLARPGQAHQLQADARRRARRAAGAERAGVGRPARRHAGGAGAGLHRVDHRAEPAADASRSSSASCCARPAQGGEVRLRDVARVEIGTENYGFAGRYNGKPAAGIGIKLAAGANALATADAVQGASSTRWSASSRRASSRWSPTTPRRS